MTDTEYMRIAYELAQKGRGRTSPNPMVGAAVVRAGRIVGKGWHRRCGAPHAEVLALRQAGSRARRAKLYVTLEPCGHTGRTPPCVDAVIRAGIREVVIGMKDPNPLTNGRSIAKLKRAGIKIRCGFLSDELRELNEAFIKYVRLKMPFVVTKTAQTLDGRIATAMGESQWITSGASRAFARRLRDGFDAIMVGAGTVRKDDPRLDAARPSKKLKKIILDPRLTVNPRSRLFRGTVPSDIIIAVTSWAPAAAIGRLQQKGVQVLVCPGRGDRIPLKWLMRRLARQEITSVLIEGGGRVVGSALKEGIADKMYIYVAPMVIGDQNAVGSITGLAARRLRDAVRLRKWTVTQIGSDLLIEGIPA